MACAVSVKALVIAFVQMLPLLSLIKMTLEVSMVEPAWPMFSTATMIVNTRYR